MRLEMEKLFALQADDVKVPWPPAAVLAPVPAVIVSCGRPDACPNLITVAWAGTVNSDPPMISISVRPERYSFPILLDTGEFVVNLPSRKMARATDQCGVLSGRKVDKFAHCGLTAKPGLVTSCPVIGEAPVNLECKVRHRLDLGSHTMFVGEVVAVQAAQRLFDEKGRFGLEKAGLFAFAHGHYYELGAQIGKFGWSAEKRKNKK